MNISRKECMEMHEEIRRLDPHERSGKHYVLDCDLLDGTISGVWDLAENHEFRPDCLSLDIWMIAYKADLTHNEMAMMVCLAYGSRWEYVTGTPDKPADSLLQQCAQHIAKMPTVSKDMAAWEGFKWRWEWDIHAALALEADALSRMRKAFLKRLEAQAAREDRIESCFRDEICDPDEAIQKQYEGKLFVSLANITEPYPDTALGKNGAEKMIRHDAYIVSEGRKYRSEDLIYTIPVQPAKIRLGTHANEGVRRFRTDENGTFIAETWMYESGIFAKAESMRFVSGKWRLTDYDPRCRTKVSTSRLGVPHPLKTVNMDDMYSTVMDMDARCPDAAGIRLVWDACSERSDTITERFPAWPMAYMWLNHMYRDEMDHLRDNGCASLIPYLCYQVNPADACISDGHFAFRNQETLQLVEDIWKLWDSGEVRECTAGEILRILHMAADCLKYALDSAQEICEVFGRRSYALSVWTAVVRGFIDKKHAFSGIQNIADADMLRLAPEIAFIHSEYGEKFECQASQYDRMRCLIEYGKSPYLRKEGLQAAKRHSRIAGGTPQKTLVNGNPCTDGFEVEVFEDSSLGSYAALSNTNFHRIYSMMESARRLSRSQEQEYITSLLYEDGKPACILLLTFIPALDGEAGTLYVFSGPYASDGVREQCLAMTEGVWKTVFVSDVSTTELEKTGRKLQGQMRRSFIRSCESFLVSSRLEQACIWQQTRRIMAEDRPYGTAESEEEALKRKNLKDAWYAWQDALPAQQISEYLYAHTCIAAEDMGGHLSTTVEGAVFRYMNYWIRLAGTCLDNTGAVPVQLPNAFPENYVEARMEQFARH